MIRSRPHPISHPKITISGFDIEWDLEKGINLWAGFPTLSMWIGTTTAGMMAGFQRMVGEDRFNLCMQIGGLNSVELGRSVSACSWRLLGQRNDRREVRRVHESSLRNALLV